MNYDICPVCNGTGKLIRDICPLCDGEEPPENLDLTTRACAKMQDMSMVGFSNKLVMVLTHLPACQLYRCALVNNAWNEASVKAVKLRAEFRGTNDMTLWGLLCAEELDVWRQAYDQRAWRTAACECQAATNGMVVLDRNTIVTKAYGCQTTNLGIYTSGCVSRGHRAGHAARINAVAVDNVSGQIASGDVAGEVRVWQFSTGECVATRQHGAKVYSLAICDSMLASGGNDRRCRLHSLNSQGVKATREIAAARKAVHGLALSTTALAARAGTEAVVYTLGGSHDGLAFSQRFEHPGGVTALTMTDDMLFTGCSDGMVRCFSLTASQCLYAVQAHTSPVTSLARSGDVLVSAGGQDCTARMWSTHNGAALATFVGTGWAQEIGFSLEGRFLVVVESLKARQLVRGRKPGAHETQLRVYRPRTSSQLA